MASQTIKQWDDADVAAILAATEIATKPELAGIPWTFEISPDGWMRIIFSADAQNTTVRLEPSLAARVLLMGIEQSAALQTRGLEETKKLGEQMIEFIKANTGMQ